MQGWKENDKCKLLFYIIEIKKYLIEEEEDKRGGRITREHTCGGVVAGCVWVVGQGCEP